MGWPALAVLGTVVATLGLGLTVALIRRQARALDELTQYVEALGEGRPVRPVQGAVRGATGRLARRFGVAAASLEQKLDRLEEERRQLGAVLQGMAEGVIAVDGRRRLVFANHAAARLFNLGPEAVGRRVAELIRSPRVQEAVEATLAHPEPHRAEIIVPHAWPGGQDLILSVLGTPLPGSPTSGAVLVFHDVTEMRRLERVRQDFVANASHELKSPLASIKAYTEILLDGALHDEAVNSDFLRRIDEQADRLHGLVQDLLTLARLESGQETFRHAPLVLAPVIRRCVEAHRARAEAKGLQYEFQVDATAADAQAVADEEAIRQVLDNLIDNALKYTPSGGRVVVSLRAEAEAVIVEVADTGLGIPRDALSRVFERFYRVDQARSRAVGGTGLGLSIVRHLVGSLQGVVEVKSRVGAGSSFTVRLPRAGTR